MKPRKVSKREVEQSHKRLLRAIGNMALWHTDWTTLQDGSPWYRLTMVVPTAEERHPDDEPRLTLPVPTRLVVQEIPCRRIRVNADRSYIASIRGGEWYAYSKSKDPRKAVMQCVRNLRSRIRSLTNVESWVRHNLGMKPI